MATGISVGSDVLSRDALGGADMKYRNTKSRKGKIKAKGWK